MKRRGKWGIVVGAVVAALVAVTSFDCCTNRTGMRSRHGDSRPAVAESEVRQILLRFREQRARTAMSGEAIAQLAALGPPAAEALARELGSDDLLTSDVCRLALLLIGRPAVPALAASLESRSQRRRGAAALALMELGRETDEAVGVLSKALQHEDAAVRLTAAWGLGGVGPAARSAGPALRKLAQTDEDEDVRAAAAEALKRIQSEQEER